MWSPDTKSYRTSTIHDNTNPIFYETVEFSYYTVNLDYAPPFMLYIKDLDQGVIKDSSDYVGRAVIPYEEASVIESAKDIPKPKWHPIKMGFDEKEPAMGQILVSFAVVKAYTNFVTPLSKLKLTPPSSMYRIEINILGLRDLQSAGILPVKKAFIKFNLKSILHPEKANAVENIRTQPSASGPNPTISTVIKFQTHLPSDTLFCPSLS